MIYDLPGIASGAAGKNGNVDGAARLFTADLVPYFKDVFLKESKLSERDTYQ